MKITAQKCRDALLHTICKNITVCDSMCNIHGIYMYICLCRHESLVHNSKSYIQMEVK